MFPTTPPAVSRSGRIVNAITVDVEDYFHVSGFADRIHPRTWDDHQSRVVANTRRILRLLDRHSVRATFFVLGWVADRFPQLVREIQQDGHEIGCHSYWHRLIYTMSPEEFRADLRQANGSIAEITGEPVRAFRAPSFSITSKSLWALSILIEEGIRFDSSIFPVRHARYGIPTAERFPHTIERPCGRLVEFPPSVYRVGRFNLPVAGGGYFRLYPFWLSRSCLASINRSGRPFLFYIHPWELDPEQPRLPGRLRSRYCHYRNLGATEKRLERLLTEFDFAPLTEALDTSAPASAILDGLFAEAATGGCGTGRTSWN